MATTSGPLGLGLEESDPKKEEESVVLQQPSAAAAAADIVVTSSSAAAAAAAESGGSDATRPLRPLFEGERVFLGDDVARFGDPAAPDLPLSAVVLARGGSIVADLLAASLVVLSPEKMLFALDRRTGARVLSTTAVRESLERNKPLPTGPIVLCRAMDGIVLACDSDVLTELGTDIREMVELMGGRFVGDQLPADATTFCGKTALSQGFQVASQRSLPAVRPVWITSCFRAMTLIPITSDFALPALAGCVVCVTGFSVASRQNIQQMVVSLGGSFSPEFSRRCTHLIAAAPVGPKFRASQVWRIPAVNLDWILDSVNMKACQSTAPYIVHDTNAEMPFSLSAVPTNSSASLSAIAAAAAAATGSASGPLGSSLLTEHSRHQQQQQQQAQAILSSSRHRRRAPEGPALQRHSSAFLSQMLQAAPPHSSSGSAAPAMPARKLTTVRKDPYVRTMMLAPPRQHTSVPTPAMVAAAAATAAATAAIASRTPSPPEEGVPTQAVPMSLEDTLGKLQEVLVQTFELCDAAIAQIGHQKKQQPSAAAAATTTTATKLVQK